MRCDVITVALAAFVLGSHVIKTIHPLHIVLKLCKLFSEASAGADPFHCFTEIAQTFQNDSETQGRRH